MATADPTTVAMPSFDVPAEADTGTVYLAGGCFWCTEGVFERLPGVTAAISGYAGGEEATANYKAVCTGSTGHAEVIKVDYDQQQIGLGRLLQLFFAVAHDPTTLNRQGADIGTQYRSAIFYENEAQRDVASKYIQQLDESGVFGKPIVTTIEPLEAFYVAEDYHQGYAEANPNQPYIACTALPKMAKLDEMLAAGR